MARFSSRAADLRPSPVREMLRVTQQPGMISFAGGLPSPESFGGLDLPPPPSELLQYGPSEGEPALRERLAKDLSDLGLDCGPDRVLVLSGSQQGIDLVAKLFVDPGTPVALESPAYLAALQVFRFFGADLRAIDRSEPAAGWHQASPAFAYVVPTFQNPGGHCWSAVERQALAAGCESHGVVLFEDDPYRELVYEPCERRPACTWMRAGSWIYQGSFSKTIAPGLRLGFMTASADLFPHLVRLKQAADLHTNRIAQWTVLQYLEDSGREARLERIAAEYRAKRDAFAAGLERHLGDLAEWTLPSGGLFFWVRLKVAMDMDALWRRAMAANLLFTPGHHFLIEGQGRLPAMRLNFSLVDGESAERGLELLGRLLREALAERAA